MGRKFRSLLSTGKSRARCKSFLAALRQTIALLLGAVGDGRAMSVSGAPFEPWTRRITS